MASIRKILKKVYPKLRALEENPTLTLLRISASIDKKNNNPFEGPKNETYDKKIELTCIYSEQPEMVTGAGNVSTQQQVYFYLQMQDIELVTLKDRFIFRDRRYRPVEIQDLFGMWKIKVVKE